mgnify:CR=1 FL=1
MLKAILVVLIFIFIGLFLYYGYRQYESFQTLVEITAESDLFRHQQTFNTLNDSWWNGKEQLPERSLRIDWKDLDWRTNAIEQGNKNADMTLSFWIHLDGIHDQPQNVFRVVDPGYTDKAPALRLVDDKLHIIHSTVNSPNEQTLEPVQLPQYTPVFVTVVFTVARYSVYLNGAFKAQYEWSAPPFPVENVDNAYIEIGQVHASSVANYKLHRMQLEENIRSPGEVLQLYEDRADELDTSGLEGFANMEGFRRRRGLRLGRRGLRLGRSSGIVTPNRKTQQVRLYDKFAPILEKYNKALERARHRVQALNNHYNEGMATAASLKTQIEKVPDDMENSTVKSDANELVNAIETKANTLKSELVSFNDQLDTIQKMVQTFKKILSVDPFQAIKSVGNINKEAVSTRETITRLNTSESDLQTEVAKVATMTDELQIQHERSLCHMKTANKANMINMYKQTSLATSDETIALSDKNTQINVAKVTFQDNQFVTIDDCLYVPDNGLTIAFWFYTAETNGAFFEFGNGTAQDSIRMELSAGGLYCAVDTSVSDMIAKNLTNAWYHVVWSLLPNGTWNLYINGIRKKTFAGKPYPANVKRSMKYIGRKIDGSYFTGDIADYRVHRGAADDARATSIYTKPLSKRTTSTTESFVTLRDTEGFGVWENVQQTFNAKAPPMSAYFTFPFQ